MSVFKMTEWEGGGSKWYCGDVSKISQGSNYWCHPARILNITPAAFIELLVNKYHAEIYYSDDLSFVGYCWKKQSDMRLFKNMINAAARKINYQI